jgi:hypothetical protein
VKLSQEIEIDSCLKSVTKNIKTTTTKVPSSLGQGWVSPKGIKTLENVDEEIEHPFTYSFGSAFKRKRHKMVWM